MKFYSVRDRSTVFNILELHSSPFVADVRCAPSFFTIVLRYNTPSHSYEGEGCRMEDGAEEMCPFRSLSGKSQANAISGKDFLEQFLEREQGQKICGSSECMGFSLH